MTRRARWWLGAALAAATPVVGLLVAALCKPLPAALTPGLRPSGAVALLDRHGVRVSSVRADDGTRARYVPLAELSSATRAALLAAEDARFAWHPGVDPLAVARALGQAIAQRRIVSGASTLTQQLARTVAPHPRTLLGKLDEMALALRIEASLSKDAVLEAYVNLVTFGPGVRGIDAASRAYFDKPASELSLAESAALAALPRGPSWYDPRRHADRLARRRDRVLDRMEARGLASREDAARARLEPIRVSAAAPPGEAPHFTRALLAGQLDAAAGVARAHPAEIETTLDRELQRRAERLARDAVADLDGLHASAAAAVVLENATGEVLAWVGSPDALDRRALGANDGVLAQRQPGSALKPFVYELAFERLGWTAATLVPDVELALPNPDGTSYVPHDYDRRWHGPVRIREALGSSYNVPAVFTADRLGPAVLLERLRALGFASLGDEAEHYGAALALGDGEVRLVDLAAAYATLARGGLALPVRAVRAVDGLRRARPEPARVLDETATRMVVDVLADPSARRASFGDASVLDLPFPAAVKTGTSKGFRDNVAVGFTREITVAVWVGNFDGSPMQGVSGVAGAGPLLRELLLAATPERRAEPLALGGGGTTSATICPLSGLRAGPACPHAHGEAFAEGRAPAGTCSMHAVVRIDRANGLLAGAGCRDADVEARVVEVYPAAWDGWARAAGRPRAPEASSPRCPPPQGAAPTAPRVTFPPRGASFALDPALGSGQTLALRAETPAGTRTVRFVVDGATSPPVTAPFVWSWPLCAGAHQASVEADGVRSDVVAFAVE